MKGIDIREYWRRPTDHVGCSDCSIAEGFIPHNSYEKPENIQIRTVYDLLSGLLMEDWELEGEELGGKTIWHQLWLKNVVEIGYDGTQTESGPTGRASTEKSS